MWQQVLRCREWGWCQHPTLLSSAPLAATLSQILSTNTRRTKVVELSTGTHRVADELRRHSLADGEGGHYGTNLDRNRYGSDNNYLFTGACVCAVWGVEGLVVLVGCVWCVCV